MEKTVEQKPEVAFFVYYTSIFYCGPWRNSVRLWIERGYKVNVFQIADPHNRRYKSAFDNSFILNEIKGYYLIKFFRESLDRIFKPLRYLGLKKLSNLGGEFIYLLTAFYFVFLCYLKADKRKKHILIGGDPPGLLAAYLLSRIKGNMLVYWSLELWIEKDLKDFIGQRIFKRIERWANKKALCTIEFGEKRCELLRIENNLPKDSMISMPNSPIGEARIERNYYFNDKFLIPREKKIILYAGGLGGDFYGIKELLEHVDSWPENSVLVLHSRVRSALRKIVMSSIIVQKRYKVYLDMEPVEYDQLPFIYSSCDIGLQVWKPANTNLMYPDLSSGKIFHYLQAGVPIIVRDLMGYKEFVEGNGIGICVGDMSQVGIAIREILKEEDGYKENCIKIFNKFRFEDYHKKLMGKIEGGISLRADVV